MTHPNKTLLEALERIDAALEQTSLLNGVPYHPVKTVDEIRLDVPNVVGQINAFILLLNAYPAIRTALTAAGEARELRNRVAAKVAPHLRGMSSFGADAETVHQNRDYALKVADAILSEVLPQPPRTDGAASVEDET